MKSLIRHLGKARHALAGNVLMGAMLVVAGLIQANVALMLGGIVAILLSVAVLVATYLVDPVLEGVIVELQHPQLTDVQTHTHCTKELARAS